MKNILLFVALCLFSCQPQDKTAESLEAFRQKYQNLTADGLMRMELDGQQVKPHIISIDQSCSKEKGLTGFVDSIILLPLETTEECLISRIDKILYKNEKFYILDGEEEHLFVFNSQGKFLYQAGAPGRAPGEYQNLTDFTTLNDGTIILLDYKDLLIYNDSGKYKETLKTKYNYCSVTSAGDHLFLLTGALTPETQEDRLCRLHCLNRQGQVVQQFFPYNARENNCRYRFTTLGNSTKDNTLVYNPPLGNQVYILDTLGKLKSTYLFQPTKQNFPPYLVLALRNNAVHREYDKLHLHTPLNRITDNTLLKDYFCCHLVEDGHSFFSIYNPDMQQMAIISNNITDQQNVSDLFISGMEVRGSMPDNTILGYFPVSIARFCQKSAHENQIHLGKHDSLITSLDESDNPVLVLVRLKDNN